MKLGFIGEDEITVGEPDTAKGYAKLFMDKQCFSNVVQLNIDILGSSNFSQIFQCLNEAKDQINLFQTVRKIHIENVYQQNPNINSFKEFLVNFTKLESIEGITTSSFDPLEAFIKADKRVPKVIWSPA